MSANSFVEASTHSRQRPRRRRSPSDRAARSFGLVQSPELVKYEQLKVYKGGPHGTGSTKNDDINADLLNFIKAWEGDRS